MWVGVDGAERAGRLGLPMVLGYFGGTLSHLRPLVDTYRHFHAGADPARARAVYPY
jgi:hypothetical protein